ncbi:hypothetical protein ACTFIW_010441 [Dictyostelium discoideum]
MVVNEKQTIIELESGDYQTNLDIGPINIETMKSVDSGGVKVGSVSSGDDGTKSHSPKVIPKVKLEGELPNFEEEESLTTASSFKVGSNNSQKHPFSLGSEFLSENTIIQDDPNYMFHKLVKVNSYNNKGRDKILF